MFHTSSLSCRRRIVVVVPVQLLCYYSILLLLILVQNPVDASSASSSSSSSPKIRTIIDTLGKSVFTSTTTTTSDNDSDDVITTTKQLITFITSPGIPSLLLPLKELTITEEEENVPPLFLWEDRMVFVCRGSTLLSATTHSSDDETTTKTEQMCISIGSQISNVIVLEGITVNDVIAVNNNNNNGGGILNTRHARTLSYLFQQQQQSQHQRTTIQQDNGTTTNIPIKKQKLVLAITKTTTPDNDSDIIIDEETLLQDLRTLFQVVVGGASKKLEKKLSFDDIYDIQIVVVSTENGSKILSDMLDTLSENNESSETKSLMTTIRDAIRVVRDQSTSSSTTTTTFIATPQMAEIMATIGRTSLRLTRTVRGKVATWKSRISRGLLVDHFGKDAVAFRKRILTQYDTETICGAGIASMAPYRYEMRQQLQSFIDTSIQQAFTGQVSNLEKLTVKRFNTALLQSVDNNSKESTESILGRNAATMRKEALLFETVMEDIEIPELGYMKDKPIRGMATKLNNALNAFPDSPAAKLKRLQQVTKVVNKEKKPGQRSINFGLDLVAMLRPDGFGSLQGFAGYQLPGGNSITFGIHNDADDPQVIAQFGGVRPPLLRVQPKLRVDVEM